MRFLQDGKGYVSEKSVDKMCLNKTAVDLLRKCLSDRD